jgi:hypothetical protein
MKSTTPDWSNATGINSFLEEAKDIKSVTANYWPWGQVLRQTDDFSTALVWSDTAP